MSWIKLRTDLIDDTDVMQLADLLGVDDVKMVGALAVFWSWLDGQTADGKGIKTTFARIDEKVKIPEFSKNLIKIGWLSGNDWAVKVPNFERHNGESAKRRMQAARRNASYKARKSDAKGDAVGDAKGDVSIVTPSVKTASPKEELEKSKSNEKNTKKRICDAEILKNKIDEIYDYFGNKIEPSKAKEKIKGALKISSIEEIKAGIDRYDKHLASFDWEKRKQSPATWFAAKHRKWLDPWPVDPGSKSKIDHTAKSENGNW